MKHIANYVLSLFVLLSSTALAQEPVPEQDTEDELTESSSKESSELSESAESSGTSDENQDAKDGESEAEEIIVEEEVLPPTAFTTLTQQDYEEVAEALGVEVPAIMAVVEIEAGPQAKGFHSPGKPLINFDLSMYLKMAKRNGLNVDKYRKSHQVIFNKPDSHRYGSYQKAQQARLDAAMGIDPKTAIMGTFWGMFQIGGFNWKLCGTESPQEFARLMSRSERDQLELFAKFLVSTGLDKHLKNKDWAQFARGYNGANYASRGYHTKMANAYKKYKKILEAQELPWRT